MELEVPSAESLESDASLSRADTDNEEVNQSGLDRNIRNYFFLFTQEVVHHLYST